MKTRDTVKTGLFTALIAIGAFIRIPIPVCPFTLQFLFTNLAGILLGRRKGSIAVLIYVLLGLCGLPIFAEGGGISYCLQPTFGYLLGFIGGTFITGSLTHSTKTTQDTKPTVISPVRLFLASFAGLLFVYALGMIYYWLISKLCLQNPIGIWPLFLYCFLLAIPGDLCLCVLSAIVGKRLQTDVLPYC